MDEQALRDYFEFDEFDLNANRSGRFSEKQQKELIKELKDNSKFGVKFGLGSLVIAAIFPVGTIVFPAVFGGGAGNVIANVVWVLIFGCFGVLGLVSAFKTRKGDISKDRVQRVEGPINIVSEKNSDGDGHHFTSHEPHIGKEEFEVEEDLANLMMQRDVYTIYFDKSDHHILSLEWLSKG
jgi:hypothetical protein